MAVRFLNQRSTTFRFLDDDNQRRSYKLIFGDEVHTRTANAPSGAGWQTVRYRRKTGEIQRPELTRQRGLEMYFLDVGQGDAAFIVTPNNSKILVDGGLQNRALGFLIWKYRLNAHIFKSPHHGSDDYHQPMLNAVAPKLSVISSGDSPDHGHPRAAFLGAVGAASRGEEPLVFSTEIAATFVDAGDAAAVDDVDETPLGELDFNTSEGNLTARRRFKKTLSGIINVRSDGEQFYAARRVRASYQWEIYGPIEPVD